MRFQTKLMLLIASLLLLVMLIFGLSFEHMLAASLRQDIGLRALNVAKTVAAMPEIVDAFSAKEPWKIIDPIAEKVRLETQAEFVVVGNRERIRFSHPIPERIGEYMQGGDDQAVLEGHAIISEAVGSLGPSLRGKAPVFDKQGQVIGVVSVGFLIEDIQQTIQSYRNRILLIALATLLLGIGGTVMIARNGKKAILGLEPSEIGRLYREKRAILESIREGILAINEKGVITMANQTALQMLGLSNRKDITGKEVDELLGNSRLLEVLKTTKAEYDQDLLIGGKVLVANRVPVTDEDHRLLGAVASLRDKTELLRVTEELSQVKEYADALRAQTHEYSNKLHLISGLIQLESYEEAIRFITHESDGHINHTRLIMKEIPDTLLGGLLLGKLNRANELKVELQIDPQSSFRDVPASIDRYHLITIIGNMIDNAMEAVLSPEASAKRVHVFLTDIGEDLLIEVEDFGPGIPEEHAERIFEIGFSTKAQKNRGYGLYLVRQALEQLHGYVTYTRNSFGGTIFTIAIPKNASARRREAEHEAHRAGADVPRPDH
ncbi:ATP-binding protein [Brevibacillus migulae]|uniref:ATP-binding protein n=1 Tax=Brevibacillus migulae TaxID=1644114 RepID=UPI00196B77A0|nr:sensor histidine kinase [Brevibacillus migulae]